jgi:prefoldin subunit 5
MENIPQGSGGSEKPKEILGLRLEIARTIEEFQRDLDALEVTIAECEADIAEVRNEVKTLGDLTEHFPADEKLAGDFLAELSDLKKLNDMQAQLLAVRDGMRSVRASLEGTERLTEAIAVARENKSPDQSFREN